MEAADERLSVIIGAGARTAVGRRLASSAAAVRAGLARFTEHPEVMDERGRPAVVAMAEWLPTHMEALDRFLALGVNAAKEALSYVLRQARAGAALALPKARVMVALPEARPGLPEDLNDAFVKGFGEALQRFGFAADVETLNRGSASGFLAMERCAREIRGGDAELFLVGGVDSYIEPDTLEWLDQTGQLHSRKNRWGFIPGEGAGFCLIASSNLVDKLRLPALGHILGVGTAREANRIRTETVCVGAGLTEALRGALAALPEGAKADQVVGDLNGEPYRADELGFTTVRVGKQLCEPSQFLAPASSWGDVGAASAPLFAGLALEAARRGYAAGPFSLLWASSEGGDRGAALVHRTPAAREPSDWGD